MEDEEEGIEILPEAIVRLYSAFGIRGCWRNKEGNYHRLNGPAIEWRDGTEYWYRHGKLHRDDGPATNWPPGQEEWHKDGVKYEPSAHEIMVWKMKKKEC
jgi:hypothetical protein